MKNNIYIILISLLTLTSCEKVINVNLNDSSPQYVIEATVTNTGAPARVKITRSVNFDQNNSFPGVDGAIVHITDGDGRIYHLLEVAPGDYQQDTLIGIEGMTYNLEIDVNGHVFTSASTMPQMVQLDSLVFQNSAGFQKRIVPQVVFNDPPNVVNYYNFVVQINGVYDKNIIALNDNLSDGLTIHRSLRTDTDIAAGDMVTVELQCINTGAYTFFSSLDKVSGGGMSGGTPGNPITNIVGGALGYFSAYTSDVKSAIAPKL
ncbi:MAG TPA: DUF4249 domain-containing protein [Williamwhitmania sp.]|nr:DUF4249 domain-containing protein [Williamwhitmania sp.]